MKNNFGNFLRHKRVSADYSQEGFARKVGIDTNSYGFIERGYATPTAAQLKTFAKELGFTVSESRKYLSGKKSFAAVEPRPIGSKSDIIRLLVDTRTKAGISFEELSRRSGIWPNKLKAIEAGRLPSLAQVVRIAKVIGFDLNDLKPYY